MNGTIYYANEQLNYKRINNIIDETIQQMENIYIFNDDYLY